MIKVGDRIPSVKLKHMTADGPKDITTDELFKGKKVVLFALPGAFTPTCSAKHLPAAPTHVVASGHASANDRAATPWWSRTVPSRRSTSRLLARSKSRARKRC